MATIEELSPVRPGDVIDGKYDVEAVLGSGAMGVVVTARHRVLGHRVAIKVIAPHKAQRAVAIERFTREARAVAGLEGDHVVRLLDFGFRDDAPYMVMQHLAGRDLATEARTRGGRLPIEEAVDYVLHACVGLAEAHARGIVHRDIKPSNLFLTRRVNGEPLVKVLDFGISKTLEPSGEEKTEEKTQAQELTGTEDVLGSPLYMSPEQIRRGNVDARADVWALGVVLFRLITGGSPFEGDGVTALLVSIIQEAPRSMRDLVPEVPEALERVVMRALEKQTDDRWQSVVDLARELQPFATVRGLRAVEELPAAAAPDATADLTPSGPAVASAHGATAVSSGVSVVMSTTSMASTASTSSVLAERTNAPAVVDSEPSKQPWRRWPQAIAAGGLVIALGIGTTVYTVARSRAATKTNDRATSTATSSSTTSAATAASVEPSPAALAFTSTSPASSPSASLSNGVGESPPSAPRSAADAGAAPAVARGHRMAPATKKPTPTQPATPAKKRDVLDEP